ncbi:hypothetical protein Ahia01_001184300, partial [Argonauta hians]
LRLQHHPFHLHHRHPVYITNQGDCRHLSKVDSTAAVEDSGKEVLLGDSISVGGWLCYSGGVSDFWFVVSNQSEADCVLHLQAVDNVSHSRYNCFTGH